MPVYCYSFSLSPRQDSVETAWNPQQKPKWAYERNATFAPCQSWDMVIVLISRRFTRSQCWEIFHSLGEVKVEQINYLPYSSLMLVDTHLHVQPLLWASRSVLFSVYYTYPVNCHRERQFCVSHSKSKYSHRNIQILCYLIWYTWFNLNRNKIK